MPWPLARAIPSQSVSGTGGRVAARLTFAANSASEVKKDCALIAIGIELRRRSNMLVGESDRPRVGLVVDAGDENMDDDGDCEAVELAVLSVEG